MVNWLVFVLWIVLLPLLFLSAGYRLISIELAVGVVWLAFLVSLAVGLSMSARESDGVTR